MAALAEGEQLGSREFVTRYGFRATHAGQLWHRGEEFDAAAILGVAYLKATGRAATKDDLPAGQDGVAEVLNRLGFDVVPEEPTVASAPRANGAPAAARSTKAAPSETGSTKPNPAAARSKKADPTTTGRRTKTEPMFTICPRCQMALPSTGVCDNCD